MESCNEQNKRLRKNHLVKKVIGTFDGIDLEIVVLNVLQFVASRSYRDVQTFARNIHGANPERNVKMKKKGTSKAVNFESIPNSEQRDKRREFEKLELLYPS